MLSSIRKFSTSFLGKAVIALIAIAFVVGFGFSGSFSGKQNIVAEITNDPSQSNVENMIGDVNKIIAFVSVDAIVGSTMSLQLATESTIQSISPTEGLGIQSL